MLGGKAFKFSIMSTAEMPSIDLTREQKVLLGLEGYSPQTMIAKLVLPVLEPVKTKVVKCDLSDIDLPSLTLPQMCWSGAEKFQDNLALVDAVNGDSFTFSEARSLARSFGSGLVRIGGQAADVVAIVLPNMPQYALAFMGAAE